MFVTYMELLNIPEMKDVNVIAGKEGMGRYINWCHVVEVEDAREWTTPGMLVFTTGVGIKDTLEESLINIVKSLARKNSAGLVLGIGPYINEIPPSIIKLADSLSFPLMTIPGKVKYADISYKVANMIFEKHATLNRQQLMMENIINDSANDYSAELEYYGYLRNVSYRYVTIRRHGKGRVPEKMTDAVNICINRIREKTHRKIFFLNRMNQIILLVPDPQTSDEEFSFEMIINTIKEEIDSYSCSDRYVIAVSNKGNDASKLSELYQQTQALFIRGQILFPDKQVLYYSDLGVLALLDFGKEDEAKSIIAATLGDVAKDRELIESLHTYIMCGNNMQQAADELYIHVNTMKYRMKKIESMLPEGITKNKVFELEGAIYMAKYYGMLSESDK